MSHDLEIRLTIATDRNRGGNGRMPMTEVGCV